MLRETARLAYSDIRELFDEHGSIKPTNQWPADLAAAIQSIEVTRRSVAAGDGREDVVRVRFWDKLKALEMLMRHLGLFRDRLEVDSNAENLELLKSARQAPLVS